MAQKTDSGKRQNRLIHSQKKDYEWFEKNRESLYQKYPDKFAVISNEAILGVFDTFDEALEHALDEKKAGEFLIQQCLKDFEPVQYYNKAVFF